MLSYQYAYLLAGAIVLFFWVLLFFARKDLRHKMLVISLVGGILALLSEPWYIRDYWLPQTITGTAVGVEDFLFGFAVTGVASIIYEEIFGKHYAKRHKRKHNAIWFLIPFIGFFFLTFNTFFPSMRINSIYASSLASIFLVIIMIYYRRDLWFDAVMSGILFGILYLLMFLPWLQLFPEAITRWWFLKNISGITLFAIPIEEFVWAISWGMFAGPVYEFYAGLVFKNGKKR